MIPPARRIFPGMLASLLLTAPLLAPTAHAAAIDPASTEPPRKALEQHRRPAIRHKLAARAGHVFARRRHPAPAPHMAALFDDQPPAAAGGHASAPHAGAPWHQTGIASWYGGPRWQGHQTASGARYDQDALTAAHATLPLGSRVRVALAGSDRSVIVTITDRPGTRSRIIDLSRRAASALGIIDRGIAPVTLSLP